MPGADPLKTLAVVHRKMLAADPLKTLAADLPR
jgi:hypothetical protein